MSSAGRRSERAGDAAARTSPRDAEATYRRVVSLVEAWEPAADAGLPLARALRRYLDRELNVDGRRHTVERGRSAHLADVVVDGGIGVKLYRDFSPGTVSTFRRLVGAGADSYDYLVVRALRLPEADLDRWRMGKMRYTADRSPIRDIAYISPDSDDDSPSSRWPTGLWHYAEAIIAGLAVVIGVEIAVLLQLNLGGMAPLLGPGATLAVVFGLMVLLVLVYENTEV